MSYKKHGVNPSRVGTSSLAVGLTSEVVQQFYQALDCPRSLTASILFKYGEFDQLVGLECDPSHYATGEMFRDAYLASSFLTRSKFLETSFDRKSLAIDKFLKFEDGCKEVNRRFRSYFYHHNEFDGSGKLLSAMRRKINRILGPFDPDELFELASWGPGVSTHIKGEETFGAKKFQFETGVTRDLYPLVKDLFPLAYPGWWEILKSNTDFPSFEVGNAIVTVPKTSKIDRVIAIEPGLNLWFQLGLGSMIRRRLGRVGIDLTDQTRNQSLARSSSISGDLATVDLSSASDSISTALVEYLFSASNSLRWYETMDLCRSKYGIIDEKVFRWEKFSSMGNGFTFDLETLIFYAAATCICEDAGVSIENVSVYGDDVILPSILYESFCSLCEYLGFTVNLRKSYTSGNFRESCGAHYYRGLDCKPVYLEDELTLPVRVYNLANILRLRAHTPNYGCDSRFRRLFYNLVTSLPKSIRFRIPAIVNRRTGLPEPLEGGFISNFDEACPQRARQWIEGYIVKRLSWISIVREVDYPGLLLARLSQVFGSHDYTSNGVVDEGGIPEMVFRLNQKQPVESAGNENPLRGRTKCVFLKNAFVHQWYDLGPWL